MSVSITKEEAYSVLKGGLSTYITNILTEKYGSDWKRNSQLISALRPGESTENLLVNPLQALLQLWNPIFKYHVPFSHDTIATLDSIQYKQLSIPELRDAIQLMIVTLSGIGATQQVAILQQSISSSSSSLTGTEGIALVGGAAAAGYLLYKGASYLLGKLSLEEQSDPSESEENGEERAYIGERQPTEHRRAPEAEDPSESEDNDVRYARTEDSQANGIVNDEHVDNAARQASADRELEASGEASASVSERSRRSADSSGSGGGGIHASESGTAETSTPTTTDDDNNNPFLCPITLQMMEDPVITPQGICFERTAILDWLEKKHTCPITNKPLTADNLITCYTIRNAIEEYKKQHNKQILSSLPSANYSFSSPSPSTSSINVDSQPVKPTTRIVVGNSIADKVKVWSATKLCSEDRCPRYPEGSKFIVFPASKNFVVDKCTGYIGIENRGDYEVTLISRQREANAWEPFNIGARQVGSFVLPAHSRKGFDFRGYFCIEVPYEHIQKHSVDLFIYEFGREGGGRGNALKMY